MARRIAAAMFGAGCNLQVGFKRDEDVMILLPSTEVYINGFEMCSKIL